jgi:hypothetical protein
LAIAPATFASCPVWCGIWTQYVQSSIAVAL